MKLTSLAHYIGGFLTGLISIFNLVTPILLAILFIIYETYEGWELRDESYADIREFLVGLFASVPVVLGVNVFG